ncbi:hypothetical protein [Xanthomonas sp. MLO165]|uniref:hypothetical protein n=1 Tax=Xanthomonas sp. MLO165 TaxID=2081477 RepID=UPI00207BC075|nr:hypothetical protein [Xanthomonas sp. MLO165]
MLHRCVVLESIDRTQDLVTGNDAVERCLHRLYIKLATQAHGGRDVVLAAAAFELIDKP